MSLVTFVIRLIYYKKMSIMSIEQKNMSEKYKMWFKRVGVAGFLFFLLKGLVWVAIFMGAGKCFFQ
jgi:hypothetical protein